MRRLGLILAVAAASVFLLSAGVLAQGQAAPAGKITAKFVGAKGCKMCHFNATQGKQYDIWFASKHAKAYAALATPEAKKIATEKGIADPQKDSKCLKCHVTGYDAPKEMLAATYAVDEGVSCESCHGAGEKYKDMKIMKDKALAQQNGLIIPDEKTCTRCHNSESPTYKAFKFVEAKKLIAHPKPPKAQG